VEPDTETLAWVRETLGEVRIASHFAHSHGGAQLWRLATASDHVWLKLHARRHKWEGEVHALVDWGGPLMPRLLASRPGAVLLTECEGDDATTLAGSAAERMWTEAGAWLRRFHARTGTWFGNVTIGGAPNGEVSTDPTFQLTKGFTMRVRQGRDSGLLDAATIAVVEKRFLAGLDAFRDAQAHSTHRDFHPRNWLAAPDGKLTAVIDFEHARWDLLAVDHIRSWDNEFLHEPRLVEAFYSGYGEPDAQFRQQIETVRLWANVVSAVWAEEVGDSAYCRQNLEGLARIITSTSSQHRW
jgi:hypothetical protein